jgi:GAF domain-containing protein
MKPLLPAHEDARLAELREYNVLDTGPEPEFDDLVGLASQICGTPIALISLIDAQRQFFKARTGLDVTQTPRDAAFCDHAIAEPELMVVPDAAADPRLAGNPLVTSDPNIRFYAGSPLITPKGHAMGTLCVIDRVKHLVRERSGCGRVVAQVGHLGPEQMDVEGTGRGARGIEFGLLQQLGGSLS